MRTYLLIAANESGWGGSEYLWSRAAERLSRDGNAVRVSVGNACTPMSQAERLRAAGCAVFTRPPLVPPLLRRAIGRIVPHKPFPESHIEKLGRGADLVVISQGVNSDGVAWMETARRLGRRYVVISQSAVLYWSPDDDVAERIAAGHEGAAATYFVSRGILEISRRQFSSPLRNAKVVRNPFNVRYDAHPAWPTDVAEGELKLACVARLEISSKSQDLLLQVLGLPKWKGRPVRLSLIGNGPNERGLRYLAKQLELESVDFCGHWDNIEEIWSRHHALVLPSRFEGMPLSLVEAMLCGRAAIVTDVGGNAELVRDGVNGFLAKAATVELVDEAMERAWQNRHRLREMGDTAARDVRAWVSADPVGEFVRELESVANGHAPGKNA
jgi:glycosyltransferase involved in cell wall biosynthesis